MGVDYLSFPADRWCLGVHHPGVGPGESGWVYNRFRYYDPTAGVYGAQDPLGVARRLVGAQGYVDHADVLVDPLGLNSHPIGSNPEINMGKYNDVAGHHVPAKATVNGTPGSRQLQNQAPSVPISELKAPGNSATGSELHKEIAKAQKQGYKQLNIDIRESGADVTWSDIRKVDVNADTSVGFTESQATAMADEGKKILHLERSFRTFQNTMGNGSRISNNGESKGLEFYR